MSRILIGQVYIHTKVIIKKNIWRWSRSLQTCTCMVVTAVFVGIMQHSPDKPVLIFVSSRRQTRLTALDLIALLAAEDNPKQWLNMEEIQVYML